MEMFLLTTIVSFSQIPSIDRTWQQKFVDNFDSYNSTNWYNQYSWGSTNNGAEVNLPRNVLFEGGYLKLKAKRRIIDTTVNGNVYSYESGTLYQKINPSFPEYKSMSFS